MTDTQPPVVVTPDTCPWCQSTAQWNDRLPTQSAMQARIEELEAALRDTSDMLRRQHNAAPGHVSNAEKVNAMLDRARAALTAAIGGDDSAQPLA